MVIYVTEMGSDRQDLMDTLISEGVTYQECKTGSVREMDTVSYGVIEVQANLPEVKVPNEYRESDGSVRAFRLPSGRLILTDMEGNLEQIATAPPSA
jgi:hypothetical protein